MKVFVLLSICAVVLAEDYLDTLVHHYHYKDLGSEVVKAHMNCFLESGSCDDIALSFKKIIPEVLTTKCARCSEEQKNTGWLFVTSAREHIPLDLEKFKLKYDPENKYFDALVAAIKPKDGYF